VSRTLGIAGVGLIGGSIALRAHAAGWTTIGVDRDAASLDAARAAGALDDVAPDLAGLASRCDVVALALPIDATIAALRDVAELARPRLVFDVASVKVPVARAGAHLPTFVASHPLAGREIGGFAAADARLFDGRTWVVDPAAPAAARTELAGLIAELGAREVPLAPADHDRLVAVTSHLPQALAVALGARLAAAGDADPRAYAVCGPGIASMLRLARSPVDLWSSIFAANAAPLAGELRALARALDAAAGALDDGDAGTLASFFADAGRAVEAMERTEGPERSSPYAVPTR
jgi:prephenate dehydrogenase